ncbi:MAG: PKD domain-containing protein [Pontiella sp.]
MKGIALLAGVLLAGVSHAALVGEWKFEGGTATDTSGNGYDGTIVGSPLSVSGVESGTDAFEFGTGITGYVDIPVGAFSTVSNEVSIAVWTFGDDTLGVSAQCSAFGSNIRNTLHSHTPYLDGTLYWDVGGDRNKYTPEPSDYKGKWNFMVFTKNTTTGDAKVYINGVEDHSWSSSTTPISGITHFYIGRAGHDARTYYGKLDDFQLYDHELSALEVSDLYAAVTIEPYASAEIVASETSGNIPFEVIFSGTNSTASGTITNYMWDFGDGNEATGPLATNTYMMTGTYTSSLVVATDEGLSSTSTVEIVAESYVEAVLRVTVESSSESNAPTFYTDDLGQTAFLSADGSDGEGAGTVASLFDGSLSSQSRWNTTSIKTINFDISENVLGYDITEISTIAGWGTDSSGRSNQEYGMMVTYVDGMQAILVDSDNWAPNNDPSEYWTKVTFVETNGLPLARGVKSITWNNFANANAGSVVIAREFDILGTPTTVDYVNAGILASPETGAPPLEVVFDGSSSVSTTDIVSYVWNFGDGNFDTGVVVTNTYSLSDDYTAELVVTDANGLMSTNTVLIEVLDFVSAVATASPLSGEMPLEVAFEATNSASSGSIISYEWEFGDGKVANGAVVTNTYEISGDFTAMLVVTDSNGLTDTATIEISVAKVLSGNYVQYSEMIMSNTVPVVSSTDLAQTAYLSSSGTGGNEVSRHAQLFNGLIGDQDGNTGGDGEVRLSSGDAITVTFDTSVNTLGYDIDKIETFAGWTATTYTETQTNNASRSNQGYEISVGFSDGTFGTFAGPEHWEPNGEAVWTHSVGTEVNDTYWTKVGFTNSTGGAILTNVKSLTFKISNAARANGVVIYREFDVFGAASTGYYPNEIVMGSIDENNSMAWATDGAYSYDVQSNLNLVYGEWVTFTNVLGTPPETSVVLPPKDEDQMFYRVIVE